MEARSLTPAHLRLIDALAQRLVEDYLTQETASERAAADPRANRAPLLPADKAA